MQFAEPELKVVLFDGNGEILASQSYCDYARGNRDLKIILPIYGRRLGEILIDETGSIRFEDNKWKLAEIITLNPNIAAMNLLGKIAEAAIVRKCADDAEKNREFFQRARRVGTQRRTAARFHAIGTGLNSTKIHFLQRYNPSDPQRDIIWLDNDNAPALMYGTSNRGAGIEAGLQIKVSVDGMRYILNDLLSRRYEVPLVYFPLHNDFERIFDVLSRKRVTDPFTNEIRPLEIGEDFIDVRALDYDVFEEVKSYFPLVLALLNDEIRPKDLVYEATGNPLLQNAVVSSVLQESPNTETIIFH